MQRNNKFDAVILANGDYPTAEIPLEILKNGSYIVCCDGSADRYISEGNIPNIIIGDGDSISIDNKELYKHLFVVDSDQETNDQTKAIKFLLSKGLRNIAIVGATGKRDDHSLGNIALLTEYANMGANIVTFTDYGVFIPCQNCKEFDCVAGAQVSIFNINATEFSSEGLKYPIYDFKYWWQGTLNESLIGHFKIEAKGEYIIFITYNRK